MKNRFLRTAVILATAATLFSIGCGDKGESSEVRDDGNVKSLINRMRGTNEPKAPELYTLSVIKNPETGGSVSKSPDKEQYEKGESVMIIAAPEAGYRFTGWSGASSSANASVTITMDGNKNLTANFLPENVASYTLNVIANPTTGGTVSKSPEKLEYASGETVLVTATAETGYRFAGWSGSQTSTNTTMTVTMDGDKELVANFLTETVKTRSLTVSPNPAAGGTVSKSPDKLDYATGESVLVTATAYAGYTFTGWSGASSSTNASVTITMDDSKELIANFAPQTYTLTINAANGGSVSSDPGKSTYTYGEEVTVTAYPANGYKFTGWSGAATGTGNPITVTMNSDKNLAANFVWQGTEPPPNVPDPTYTLTAYPSLSNGGTVSINPNKTSYNANDVVYVTAEAAEGYRFVGWSGASGSTNKSVTITMNGDKELIAIFEILTYTLTVSANPSAAYGSVSRSPDRTNYSHGTAVTVTASANTGYRFTGWTGASSSTNTSVAVTMDGNKTVTANFQQIITYTVSFNANGGSGTVSSLSAQEGNSVILPDGSGLSRSGYTFGGWNTNTAGTGINHNAGDLYTPAANVTIYAKWTLNTYTITFNANGGTVSPTTGTTGEGWTLASLPTPTRNDYNFAGWFTAATGGTVVNANTVFNANATIYAQWTTLPTYTVSFNANSGTVSLGSGITGTDGKLASLPTPTRTGYAFNGWFTAPTGGTTVTTGTAFSANATVYAQWTLVTYTITYTLNSGTASPANPASYTVETSAFTLTNPTRTGYTFTGWTGTNGTTPQTDVSIPTGSTGDKNYTANWTLITYTITFDANGGTVSPASGTTGAGGTLASLPTPTRAGYTFNGWFTAATGGTAVTTSTAFSANATVYAQWTLVTYSITFNANSGTVSPASGTTGVGGTLASLPTPTRTGYTFNGWFTATTGGTAVTTSTVFTANTTIYAQWTQTYTVTFNANSGSGTVPAAQTVNAGSTITLPDGSGLSRVGYIFGGWNTNTSGTGTNYNAGSSYTPTTTSTILYAKWTLTYTVTFNANGASGTVPAPVTVNSGTAITLPNGSGLTPNDFTTLGGWSLNTSGTGTTYAIGASYTPTGNITLYAKWNAIASLADRLAWLQTYAVSGREYILDVSANESISPRTLSYSGKNNIKITLRGSGANRTLSLSSNGSMFSVPSGITLVLDNNITLQGHGSNTASLVSVGGGTLIMNNGSAITGNTITGSSGSGGGVSISGTFIMNGGTISGNTAYFAGGVAMYDGTFTMNGGTISGNTSNTLGTIVLLGATFTMNGGTISDNTSYGVGVYDRSSFTMSGGTISNNTGEGVHIQMSGIIFTKTGGTIIGSRTSNPTNGNGRYAVYAWYNTDPNGYGGTYIRTYKTPTSGPSDNLYYNSTTAPPTRSGAWDN